MTTRLILLTIAISTAHAAAAQEYVDKADANGDGFVSLYELRAAHYADPEFNRRIEQMFARYDLNGDGRISNDERRAVAGMNQDATADTPSESERRDVDEGGSQRSGVVATGAGAVTATSAGDGAIAGSEIGELDTIDLRAQKRTVTRPDVQVSTGSATTATHSKQGRPATGEDTARTGTEAWIRDVDRDGSGGASAAELLGGGQRWFSKDEFKAADRNDDGDLDAAELDALVRSLERRHR